MLDIFRVQAAVVVRALVFTVYFVLLESVDERIVCWNVTINDKLSSGGIYSLPAFLYSFIYFLIYLFRS